MHDKPPLVPPRKPGDEDMLENFVSFRDMVIRDEPRSPPIRILDSKAANLAMADLLRKLRNERASSKMLGVQDCKHFLGKIREWLAR